MGWFDNKNKEEEYNCKQCGEKFVSSDSSATENETFCSEDCKNEWKENNVSTCTTCDEEYDIIESNAVNKEKYCSKKCEKESENKRKYTLSVYQSQENCDEWSNYTLVEVKEIYDNIKTAMLNNIKCVEIKELDEDGNVLKIICYNTNLIYNFYYNEEE